MAIQKSVKKSVRRLFRQLPSDAKDVNKMCKVWSLGHDSLVWAYFSIKVHGPWHKWVCFNLPELGMGAYVINNKIIRSTPYAYATQGSISVGLVQDRPLGYFIHVSITTPVVSGLSISRSSNGYFKPPLNPDGGFRTEKTAT